jgi:uncharacterized protein with HEPN domain
MPHRDEASLLDMALACRAILEFTKNMPREKFISTHLVQDAVLYRLTVLGEAAGRVHADFRNTHPEIPWQEARGLRNHVVHDYGDVNVPLVWTIVTEKIPQLLATIEPLLPKETD